MKKKTTNLSRPLNHLPSPEADALSREREVLGHKKILRDRAIVLAQKPEEKVAEAEVIEVVEFLLSYERYAIEAAYIREICHMKEFTPLPCTPAFLFGIINLRGQILSVIDIRKFFDMPIKGITELNRVIILQSDKMEFGILADSIEGSRLIPVVEIQPPLATFSGISAEYLKGVTKDRLIMLDTERILSDEKLIINEKVM
jgi:purine-binding chemotaxis protein CheW